MQRKGCYIPQCELTKNCTRIDTNDELCFYPRKMKFASTCDFFAIYGDKKAAIFDMKSGPKMSGEVYQINDDLPRFIVDVQISSD